MLGSESLWEKVEALGYDSPTKATIAGYEALIAKSESQEDPEVLGNNRETLGNEWENLGKHLEEAQKQNIILEERLSKVPDPVEFAKVQVHFEGLQKLLEEKDERIKNLNREVEGLQKEVERLDMFAHYFKSVEVKQIEAPAAEKTKPWWRFW